MRSNLRRRNGPSRPPESAHAGAAQSGWRRMLCSTSIRSRNQTRHHPTNRHAQRCAQYSKKAPT
eukprot:13763585-Alexandrium_andersonii.AAC.1